jgi:hypothetical protein
VTYICIGIVGVGVLALFVAIVAACMLSSQISQKRGEQ